MYRMKKVNRVAKPNPVVKPRTFRHSDRMFQRKEITMQDISQWSKYKEDIKSSTTLGAILDAFEQPMYKGGLITDYELIQEIKAIVANATPPEPNTIDANTGLRYIGEQL